MKKKYIPEYSKGEIVVYLKNDLDKDFAKAFSEKIGYKFLGKEMFGGFIVKTEAGKEDEAIKAFLDYNQLVENASKRDTKYEKASEFFSKIKSDFQDLEELYDKSSLKKFRKNLEKIIKELKDFNSSF
ncbi:MAG: hypothetical protein Q8Q04_01690 [archaeon]|nr:hypothetical protein [archaeon]